MKSFLKKYRYLFLFFFITIILFLKNYSPNTYLLGWDSLQTELNPGLAVKRAFFSVWEEYQSFGLTAGMAHASDLIRASLLWIVSFILPQNIVRYFYHFLMLLIGGIGAMTLMRFIKISFLPAFLGGLFYMLNLGTVQIFYLPFEPFSTFFAFLPWGIWIFLKIISDDQHLHGNNWKLFFLINFLGTPSFYTQQLFVVYLLILGCISLGSFFKKNRTKKIFISFFLIFLINSFWIFPQIYFLKTNGHWVTESKINQISTKEIFYRNLEKGTIDNFLRLEGFYYDLKDAKNLNLFLPWKNHFSGILAILPYAFAGIMFFGLYQTFRKKNFKYIFIFLLCSIALLPATPPFFWLNSLLRSNGFINQIFRSPFTKFIIPYSLIYSYFFAQGLTYLKFIPRKFNFKNYVFFILIIIYALPAFQGYFISPEMKVKIPDDYFQLINYFKTENKSKRIALLPDYTFWGWFFNKWGYNGSGFLWYGIEQPIVSRTFDVWSAVSESYFWEVKKAIEAEDLSKFEMVLDKYNIDYLIVDYSLNPVVSSHKSIGLDRLENLINQSQIISLVFKNKNFALFKVNYLKEVDNFISVCSNLPIVGPNINLTSEDTAYFENKDYIVDNKPDVYYPFLNLTTQTRIKNSPWNIEEDGNSFVISSKISFDYKNYRLFTNSFYQANIYDGKTDDNFRLILTPQIKKNNISFRFEKLKLKTFDLSNFNNDLKEFGLWDPNLPQRYGYLVKIRSKNIKGAPLFFYIVDQTKKQPIIEENLLNETEYFILPPKFKYGLGYSFIFQNKSYQNYPSKNLLEEVSIYLFPYDLLKQTKLVKKNLSLGTFLTEFETKKLNYFTYKVKVKKGNYVILNQAFDHGWIAFANGKLLEHIKVNNWANGWRIESDGCSVKREGCLITIVFWPQYLEFLEFGLLFITFLFILFYQPKIQINENKN